MSAFSPLTAISVISTKAGTHAPIRQALRSRFAGVGPGFRRDDGFLVDRSLRQASTFAGMTAQYREARV